MRKQNKKFLVIFFILAGISGWVSSQSLYEIKRATFSTPVADDYAPVFFRNGLLFTSNRRSSALVTYESTEGIPTSNIYFVQRKDSMSWGVARLLDKSLATLFNEGPACFDSVHNILYFTRNLNTDRKNKTQVNNYGIFTAQLQNNVWTNVKPFPFNNPAYKTGHPALTLSGDTLFFVSDQPGGKGKADIYITILEQGKWTEPENLGSEVNSDSSELFPFWHPSGRLYFASNRPGTMGGLDIYYTRNINGKWLNPMQLKAPFNSVADDFGFIADKTFTYGLLTSSREGRDNIFTFNSMIPVNPGCKAMEAPVNCFMFYETQSRGIDTIPVIYQWDFGDGKQAFGHTSEHCYDNPGTYLARLNVTDTITGEVRHDVATYLVEVVKVEQAVIEAPDSCMAGEPVKISGGVEISGFIPAQYLWNFGDGEVMEGNPVEKTYYDPGIHRIQLSVISEPGDQKKIQQTCITKNIKVLLNK
ncbi:MAG: PKD domain-containing protein [Chlorobi bacterium]|nr:PKD domain-containing protein [Chlorobiota bacterium]